MKLLLQSDWQADNMTAPVKQAVQQLRWSEKLVEVVDKSLNGIGYMDKFHYKDYTPIGTVEFVKTFAEKIGVKLPDPIHATELLVLEGRWERLVSRKVLSSLNAFPCFVKPYDELKKFTGFVAKSDKDFDLYPDVDWSNTSLFLTDVLENIVSEWRCYVLNGKVFACVNYSGDPLSFPSASRIERMRIVYGSTSSYSLDVAVCRLSKDVADYKKTSFIEINDAYALGYYGGDVELYTKMLDLRWKEIIKNQ